MILKIYFGDKPVFLCDEINTEIEEYRHHPDAVYIDEVNHHAIKALLHEIVKPEFHAAILFHENVSHTQKLFWKHFTVIQAAGGLVTNENNEVLMIFRRGKWDLPKGKLDDGETLEECAVREVQEETGVSNIIPGNHLVTTYHTYNDFGKQMLKESHWYKMTAPSANTLTPQTEEDIMQLEWVKPEHIAEKLTNTFPSIIDVINAAQSEIRNHKS